MAGAPQRPPQAAPAPGGPERRRNPQPPTPAPEPVAEKGGGRRGAMLPAIVVAVALLAAAFMLKGGGGDSPEAVATTPAEEVVEEPGNPAHVISLDPVTLNLGDGSLAKVAIAIEVADPVVLEELGEETAGYGARALDELIQLMGEQTTEQLTAANGKARIKAELSKRVGEAYHGEVVAVYFTELVIP